MEQRQDAEARYYPDCKTFNCQADLDTEKRRWKKIIETLPLRDMLDWISGKLQPPGYVRQEVLRQRNAMLSALKSAPIRASQLYLSSTKSPYCKWLISDLRSFDHQRDIWKRKYEFRGRPFGIISQHARCICEGLVMPHEISWLPGNQCHRIAWGATSISDSGPQYTHARKLTSEEKELEILQTSSAPGISRHHWGTDFDIFSLEPADWEHSQALAHVYAWLLEYAKTYGFVQPFTADSGGYGKGYLEERWHWSYYPISQALLEFALTHQNEVEDVLSLLWADKAHFSFICKRWRAYMFNVNPNMFDAHIFER